MTADIPPTPTRDEYQAALSAAEDGAFRGPSDDPFALFSAWLADARAREPNDPNAMALATVDAAGLPDVRMVLLKGADAAGFVFYTNLDSAKGVQIAVNPRAALCFHWKSLRRQVRVRGPLAPVDAAEADSYFASRARDSQIGAWASAQSRALPDRFALEAAIAREALRFGLGPVQRPPHWSGFRLTPLRIEFWRDRPFRLHDRLEFSRPDPVADWAKQRLFP